MGPRIGWLTVTTGGKEAARVPFGIGGAVITTDMGIPNAPQDFSEIKVTFDPEDDELNDYAEGIAALFD